MSETDLEGKAIEQLLQEHEMFLSSAVQFEPYFSSPFTMTEDTKTYLENQKPKVCKKLIDRFAEGIWLNRAVRILKEGIPYEQIQEQFPQEWMRNVYIDMFSRLETNLKNMGLSPASA